MFLGVAIDGLNLALGLLSQAFGLQSFVANDFAQGFFYLANGLVNTAFNLPV